MTEDKDVKKGIDKHMRDPHGEARGIRRCIIVPDISKVDEVLLVLQKTGKEIINISPLPFKRTEAEEKEPIKAMIFYQDVVLHEYWRDLIKANILIDIE